MDDYVYGIDFGTTNSAVAVLDNGKPTVIPIGSDDRRMMRSALFFPNEEKKIFTGDEAITQYLDYEMDGRLLLSVKSILPSRLFKVTRIRNVEYDAVDLVSEILRSLKLRADRFIGRDVRKAVIGRPACYSTIPKDDAMAEQRLRDAAENAGFDQVRIQLEPVAAAFSYESTLLKSTLTLVADFGGGTSDFTLVKLDPADVRKPNRILDVIGNTGVHIAGDVFDSNIMHQKFKKYFGEGVHYQSWPGKWLPIPANIYHDLCNKGRIIKLYNPFVIDQIRKIAKTADDPVPVSRLLNLVENNLGFPLYDAVETGKC